MSKVNGPDLKRYMDKELNLKLNGNRRVRGVLRGFDQFMNVTLDETVEEVSTTESNQLGMVVSVDYNMMLYMMLIFYIRSFVAIVLYNLNAWNDSIRRIYYYAFIPFYLFACKKQKQH